MPDAKIGAEIVSYRINEQAEPVINRIVPSVGKVDRDKLPRCSGYSIARRDPKRMEQMLYELKQALAQSAKKTAVSDKKKRTARAKAKYRD